MRNITIRAALAVAIAAAGTGCGVDRNAAEYDERRYKELQKSHCSEMASLLAKPLLTEEPQEFDDVVARCEALKSLTFEQYKRFAEHGRATGNWDVYAVYPELRPEREEAQ